MSGGIRVATRDDQAQARVTCEFAGDAAAEIAVATEDDDAECSHDPQDAVRGTRTKRFNKNETGTLATMTISAAQCWSIASPATSTYSMTAPNTYWAR